MVRLHLLCLSFIPTLTVHDQFASFDIMKMTIDDKNGYHFKNLNTTG
jgi:hypothetical protein